MEKRKAAEPWGAALLGQFEQELLAHGRSGVLPETVHPGLRRELVLQGERLRVQGLTVETRLLPEQPPELQREDSAGVQTRRAWVHRLSRCRTYRRQGRRVGRYWDTVELHAAQAGRTGGTDRQVTEYHWQETGELCRGRHRRRFGRFNLAAGSVILLLGLLVSLAAGSLYGLAFTAILLGCLLFMADLVWKLVFSWVNTAACLRSMNFIRSSMEPGQSLLTRLQELEPMLTVSYLEEVALTLARRGMLEEQVFSDVVDTRYRGAICPLTGEVEEGGIELSLKLYVSNTLTEGGRLRQRDEVLVLSLRHEGPITEEEPLSEEKFDRWQLLSLKRN